ncbi:exodeoxyribonuclease VII, small subunit [Filifactor alocis ATCC 35896]|jgi:Exonuclease VII small subunit.|uniref:Exodeoxyribonuclease 7 small subunit n=2 Tax=Filifactor TaxID=44259 RepID=D6GSF4_FILAD|nr:exodeoxyribonuclease VII, small subunit [Filifactor alocis ATCC 35896]
MMKKLKYEEKVNRLEKVIKSLQEERLDLEESVKLYEEGLQLYQSCKEELDGMEMKLKIILDGKEETFLEE